MKKELIERMKLESGCLITAYPDLYKKIISNLIKPFKDKKITKIMATESKGYLYGPLIAYKLKIPFIPIFKSGRIPKQFVETKKFKDYSKKLKSIDIGKMTVKKGDRILLIDDVFETGKSAKATIKIIEKLKGKIIGISIIYNKMNSKEESFFKKYNLHCLVKMEK
ncbi:MAG: phosphoribosyltransferase family protein [Nanoarchaeota archaeon]|nr:phosphoribosyltransferase family protein [Nanoarchaeota archaeon]